MSGRQRIVWLCPEFTPYHEVFFAALAADPRVELRVLVMMGATDTHPFEAATERPYAWSMADPEARVDRQLLREVLREPQGTWFVVASYFSPTLMAAMRALAGAGRLFLYFTDTPLPQAVRWTDRGVEKRSWPRRLARRWRLRWIFHHAHRVLATGDQGVAAVRRLGCPPEKAVVFPYWVALGPAPPLRERAAGAGCRFVAIGQLIGRKAWEVAILAFAEVVERLRTQPGVAPPQLQLIGDGPERGSLEGLVRRWGLAERVTFSGWLQPPEIAAALRGADALVHPARWEAYGVVVLEAMAAGLPVLGSDGCMAARDRVIPGESGFIHTVGDVQQLAGQMARLATEPDLLARLARGARRMAERWPVSRGVATVVDIVGEGA